MRFVVDVFVVLLVDLVYVFLGRLGCGELVWRALTWWFVWLLFCALGCSWVCLLVLAWMVSLFAGFGLFSVVVGI